MSRTSGDGKRTGGQAPRPPVQKPGRPAAQASEIFGRFLTNLTRLESSGGTRKDGGDKR